MSNYGYFVRIKIYDGYHEKVRGLTSVDDYERVLVVQHEGDKTDPSPHFHVVIKTECKDKAFRKRMVSLFDSDKGNRHMSIKPSDGKDENYSYCFHEKDDCIVACKGHTQEDIERYKKLNKEVQLVVADAKKKASYRLEEMTLAHFRNDNRDNVSMEEVGVIMVTLALANGIYIPYDSHLKSMCMKVCYELSNENHREWFIRQYVNKALRLN